MTTDAAAVLHDGERVHVRTLGSLSVYEATSRSGTKWVLRVLGELWTLEPHGGGGHRDDLATVLALAKVALGQA